MSSLVGYFTKIGARAISSISKASLLPRKDREFLHGDEFPENTRGMGVRDLTPRDAWVDIAISIRARNLARVPLAQLRNSVPTRRGPLVDLFNYVNESDDQYTLFWKTSMWMDYEGEFFWWFGPAYTAGTPDEIHVLDPRKVYHDPVHNRWFYTDSQGERFPLRNDALIHVFYPNVWNDSRGVCPLVSQGTELLQNYHVDRANLRSVMDDAIPQGLIKTKNRITPAQADEIQERWERNYGQNRAGKKIAVLGLDSEFQPLNSELIRYLDLKGENRTTILTKYGIPLKVANAADEKTTLSGKDSNEQYKQLWSQTLIPQLRFWESALRTKFYQRFGYDRLGYSGKFDLTEIPELQVDEADFHDRLRKDIEGGIITANEARIQIGLQARDDGDFLYSPPRVNLPGALEAEIVQDVDDEEGAVEEQPENPDNGEEEE